MKSIIVTGAAGFLGINLIDELLKRDNYIYAIVRPGSEHNNRLSESNKLKIIELDLLHMYRLSQLIDDNIDIFFHLAWQGDRCDFYTQKKNIDATLSTVEAAYKLGCKRYVATGSQAEYGFQNDLIYETTLPQPIDAYGSAKLSACILSRHIAKELGIEWVWGRIFSLFGRYEPRGRLLPDLLHTLQQNNHFYLSSAKQNWDYLDVREAAVALISLADFGRDGEIYNIASGDFRPLRNYVDEIAFEFGKKKLIHYGSDVKSYNLQPCVKKIEVETGWKSKTPFITTIRSLGGIE